ncbi:hypothetical protein LCGC14_2289720, partial [marine sediment metagenome]
VIRAEKGLPEWNNWVQKFQKGLYVFISFLIIAFPLIILLILLMAFVPIERLDMLAFSKRGELILLSVPTVVEAFLFPLIIVHVALTGNTIKLSGVRKYFVLYRANFARLFIVALLNIFLWAIIISIANLSEGLIINFSNDTTFWFLIGASIVTSIPIFIADIFLHHLYGQIGIAIDRESPEQIVANKA